VYEFHLLADDGAKLFVDGVSMSKYLFEVLWNCEQRCLWKE
jgi:hypothetical protein